MEIVIPSYHRSKVLKKKTLAFLEAEGFPKEQITIFVADEQERETYELELGLDYKMVVGDYIRGIQAREAKSKQTAPAKAPSQPRPSAAPARVPAKDANSQVAKKRFTVSGNRDDLSSIIANRFL